MKSARPTDTGVAGLIWRLSSSELWRSRLVSGSAVALMVLLFAAVTTAPLTLEYQFVFAVVSVLMAYWVNSFRGRIAALIVMAMSLVSSCRYIFWRFTDTTGFETLGEVFFGSGLLLAELYAFSVLALGYFQTAWPLRRRPVPLPADLNQWPTVDVFIPTYNESLEIVKQTVFAAKTLDWPQDKLKIYVLDDGRRVEFAAFCALAGVTHLTRDNNLHAKAGNINAALPRTEGEYIAFFDCDHMPTRSFLQVTMGWFLRSPKLAMVQTPHHFFTPDPFERNLGHFGQVPNEGELFYGLVQDGNDLWDASFFCGSCAVIKREALVAIGGAAVETVTEDAHTALKLHRNGYSTAFLAVPQAAGLATDSLAGHIGQRIRWARGMAQIARVDNPLLGKGLRIGQRLCYLNAMLHFFYGLPRLIFLTAPLAYLVFGVQVIHASALIIAAYALPHLILATVANARFQGKFRHSFWNEVYETVLAWYILRPALLALINPKLGKFNVTAKGGLIDKNYFDWRTSRPYLILTLLNLTGAVFGIVTLTGTDDTEVITTIAINLVWTVYNLVMLGASLAVASEAIQLNKFPRVPMRLPVTLYLDSGRTLVCETVDVAFDGLTVLLPEGRDVPQQAAVSVTLSLGRQQESFASVAKSQDGNRLRVEFNELSMDQQQKLVRFTFARADAWSRFWGVSSKDKPLNSLREVAKACLRGYGAVCGFAAHEFSTVFRRKPTIEAEKNANV